MRISAILPAALADDSNAHTAAEDDAGKQGGDANRRDGGNVAADAAAFDLPPTSSRAVFLQ